MTESEERHWESELRRAAPAPVPAELLEKLRKAAASSKRSAGHSLHPFVVLRLVRGWYWAALSSLAIVVCLLAFPALRGSHSKEIAHSPASGPAPARLPVVLVDHALVSTYEAVAEMPGGLPVRFQCRKWMDKVEMRDAQGGLVVEQSTPRLEIVPKCLETY